MILISLRPSEAAELLTALHGRPIYDVIFAKVCDPLWNPAPPRARTITIRDEGDSLPFLAVSVDFDPAGDAATAAIDKIWEETEIEWPRK